MVGLSFATNSTLGFRATSQPNTQWAPPQLLTTLYRLSR